MRIPLIYIVVILLISSARNSSGRHLLSTADVAPEEDADDFSKDENVEDDSKTEESKEDQSEDKLPILPPIILLDFSNGTDDANATAEEKSKRTVNGGLGYGLGQNALQPRKHSYYFPAGKSGTTVSIEESVSPFLPKTIIERVQPSNQNSFASSANNHYSHLQQSAKAQSVFGLRTKPQKASAASSFETYQNAATTAKPSVNSFAVQHSGYRNDGVAITTQSPLSFSPSESVRYVTPSPVNFASPHSGSFNYVSTVTPISVNENAQTYTDQRQNIQSNVNSHGFAPVSPTVDSSTVSSLNYDSHYQAGNSQPSNVPRYTVENGVRYENKIFWKYPDGRVSDVPPATYVEYTRQQPHAIYESTTTESSILSQGPVQFPTVSDQTGTQEPNPFVSSESLASSLPQQQVYRLGYQSLLNQRQNINLARQPQANGNAATSYSFSTSSSSRRAKPTSTASKTTYQSIYRQPSKYLVNSPNPEYSASYATEPPVNATTPFNNYFPASAEYSSAPYTSNYLDTLIAQDAESKKQNFNGNDIDVFTNLRYSDLLNYNPSISEYVRNPASILNVRPTFVQAGKSLIPVIILRVDGVSPIQAKASQNINLKALLQQYLVQYAKSIHDLAQPSTYDLGTETLAKPSTSGQAKSPVLDLIRLTQEDARQVPGYASDAYIGRTSYETSNLDQLKHFSNQRYANQHSTARQKVKNVQILEDPRFHSYRAKN